MNERIIELVEITPKDFWGTQDVNLEAVKKYYPKLKIVARGTTLKAYGEEEILDEFEIKFRRLKDKTQNKIDFDDELIDKLV